ncbi:putative nuclease HARBI1 [Ixodes scapularis]
MTAWVPAPRSCQSVLLSICYVSDKINATPSERFDAEKGFRLLGRIPGVIGCVDGTMVSIVGPSKNDPTVTKAAYWCRKYFYALNVMVACDADCRIMCIDPRVPGSVHDSFVWQFSWLRNQLEQGQVPRDGRFLLGDSGYPLEPWLITPVPGNHATSTACGRFNKAHSSIRSVVERCIGLLKNRFRCLQRHRALYYHPSTATAIISACAVLHNICLASSEPEPESDSDPEESELESEPSSDGSEPSSERSASAPERLAPAGPPVGLPVGLSDRGKALRQRLVARDTVGKPLSALAAVVPSTDAASDREPLATTTEVLTTKDPVTSLFSVKPSPWKP